MKQLLILGGGTAGSMMANKLVKVLPDGWRITVVDQDDRHVYQPGLLLLPFGQYAPHELVRPRGRQLDPAIEYIVAPIQGIEAEAKRVSLEGGQVLDWDLLVVATGCVIRPELTPGLTGKHWYDSAFDFYTLEGSTALAAALERFEGGKVVINPIDMPIKCPVAPLEFALLADAYFTERGIRDEVELVYVTSLDGAFTKPRASQALGGLMASRNIEVVTEFVTSELDEGTKELVSYDGRRVGFDLLVSVPLHGGSPVIAASGIGDDLGFVPTHKHTLQSKDHPDIFVIGDATDLPTSKAGAVAHFEGDVLFENLLRHIARRGVARRLRWPRELLHRDRARQGDADRLQLRHRAAPRPVPAPRSGAVHPARGERGQPLGQARLQVDLLGCARRRAGHAAGEPDVHAGQVERMMDASLIERLDAIDAKLDRIDRRQQVVENMVDEMTPVIREVIKSAGGQLSELEARGYFAVGRELVNLADRIVTSYGPDEVSQLSDHIVEILDTVRNLTQSDVLHVVNDAADVVHDAEHVKPVSPFGAIRATREEEVQRGLGIALEVLRHLGQHHPAAQAPVRRAAPTPTQAPTDEAARPAPKLSPRKLAPEELEAETVKWEGHDFDKEGFLLDPGEWSEELGAKIAAALDVEMSDDHWTVVHWARKEYLDTGASPNVRRVAAGSGVGTRRMYELFPKSPGKTTALIAGVPKPVGCI